VQIIDRFYLPNRDKYFHDDIDIGPLNSDDRLIQHA